MATITKRGLSQYQVKVRSSGWPTQTKTFETKSEAKAWAAVIESEMARGVHLDRSMLERTSLGDILQRYAIDVTPNKLSASQEARRIKTWLKHPLAARSLATLQTADWTQYRKSRTEDGVKDDTIRLELAVIRSALGYARQMWSFPIDEALLRMGTFDSTVRERRLRFGEIERLMEGAKQSRHPLELCTVIELAIETGLRQGRLADLDWDQIDLKAGVVRVLTKAEKRNQREIAIPLSERAIQLLKALPRSIDGKVFPAFPTGNALCKAYERARYVAGITDLRFHDLRHEAASRMAPFVPAATLAKIMGWKTIQMVMRYYNPSESELVNARRRAEAGWRADEAA
ncbi:site-specific integrase [Uliginosibacterium flavum]|uniref:Site-specific integrase n=1 Tax=Uliginosibacterium flavum TaxID=1396831 RepID=A0ABV2TKK5_9RHOO